ncbi:hypothetical protein FACS1894217_09640 [Clostridia bacterium]|nr:hypothetical protein FACS1894217_09640 [Clostridia bacterium]
MGFRKITFDTTSDGLDKLCERLSVLGYDELEIVDIHRVSLYVADEVSPDPLPDIRNAVEFEPVVTHVAQEDWMNNWKQYYEPIAVGRRILIQPEWLELHNPDNRAVFWCEPGVSFGTGSHATTRLCLELLDEHVAPGAAVADLGCGSGILAVSALLLGAKSAFAADIDPQAVKVASTNAVRNGFPDMTVRQLDLLESFDVPGNNDIVCANLISDIIRTLAPKLAACVKIGGRLFASGILQEHAQDVSAVLESFGLERAGIRTSGGWAAIDLIRRA